MLTLKQVKKLARPRIDKALAKEGTVRYGEDFWSNGFLVFWEQRPEGLEGMITKADVPHGVEREAVVPVYPVELQGSSYWTDTVVHLVGQDADVWLNAHYFAAMVKRGATDFALAPKARCVACRNGRPVGLVMALNHDTRERKPEWRLANWELPRDQEEV